MRPTVSAQLAGLRRIIADVAVPEVDAPYPADMLRGVLANLEMRERSWTQVAPFLAWDNEGTERLLEHIAPLVDATFALRVDSVLAAAPQDRTDADALDAHNT